MSEAAQTTSSSLDLRRTAAGLESAVRRELVGWAWLAVGALAVAGVFAILLALSRIPGMENAPFWPLGFFYKGLVIHVVFSLVIWLMGIFAFLVSVATLELSGEDMRAAPLGRIGQGAILVAFPCLFAPAFLNATQPELANYIPLIRHPAYDFGLMALALGVFAPVVRLLVNLPGRLAPPPLAIAMALAGFIYILALACFAIAGTLLARAGELAWSRAELFWGGGHVLQFVYAVLMLTNWSILARLSLGEKAVDNRVFLICVFLVALIAIPAPAFYVRFRTVLRRSGSGVSPAAVRARRAHADVRRLARRPRLGASPSRGMAMARSRLLRLGDVARAVCAWRRDGSDDLRLGYAHARALSRGHHGGQRLQRRDAAHVRS